jgi:hypothetical protein
METASPLTHRSTADDDDSLRERFKEPAAPRTQAPSVIDPDHVKKRFDEGSGT